MHANQQISLHLTRLFWSLAGLLVFAGSSAENTGGGALLRFTKVLPPTQRVFIENTNLSAQQFFSAYMSKSVEERRYAELYLLGVLDSTEGVFWCDYRTYKTTSIGEGIFLGLKNLEKSKENLRAAYVITEILKKEFPCKGKGK